MKKFLAATALFALTVGIAASTSFSLERPFAATVPLTTRGAERVALRFAPNAARLEVRVRGAVQELELKTLEENFKGDVLVSDFNFDGYADIAVPSGSAYYGVNYFYELYTFQPSRSRFAPLKFPSDTGLCNPVIRAVTRTIEMECKNGAMYYSTDYRFSRGQPYIYRTGEMVVLYGFDERDLVYAVSVYNPSGSVLRSRISDGPHSETAPLRYLPIAKAALFSAPRETAITASYIVRGDAIRILDVYSGEAGQWVKIAYQSRKLGRITRWIYL